MLLATDVTATFHPSTIPGSRSLGVGQLNVCGIVINFTVYPSQYGQGFLVSFPSRPVIKNGVHEVDNFGKKKYMNEVYIADQAVRPIVDDAVLQAMQKAFLFNNQLNNLRTIETSLHRVILKVLHNKTHQVVIFL